MTITLGGNKAIVRQSIFAPLAILLVSRASLILLAYLGLALMPGIRNSRNVLAHNYLLNGWTRWDADWYARIAADGYTNKPIDTSGQRDTGFFPLYPLLTAGVAFLIHDVDIAGWLISNIAFIAAGLILYRLIEQRWNPQLAQRTLILLCVYPFSYVFSAMYSESLLLLCCVAAFWLAEKRLWWAAALCAAAAGATRLVGAATAVAVALMYIQYSGWSWRSARIGTAWLGVGLIGIIAFVVFLWIRFDEPLAYFRVQQNAQGWGDLSSWHAMTLNIRAWGHSSFMSFSSGDVPLREGFQLAMIVPAAVFCAMGWKRLSLPYAVWTTLVFVVSLSRWNSLGRMLCVVFPLFIAAATMLEDRRIYHGIVYASTLLLALFTLMYTHGWWVV